MTLRSALAEGGRLDDYQFSMQIYKLLDNQPRGYQIFDKKAKMKVFWSWQSDTPPECGKSFVREALQAALLDISHEYSLIDAARIDHDTKDVEGWAEITNTIFNKINDAAVFVADVTLTIESNSVNRKKSPNPNVLLELGYALKSLGSEPIILVWNTANGARPEDLPFDMRHRRGPVEYNLSSSTSAADRKNVLKTFIKTLKSILTPLLANALAKRDAALLFKIHPSRLGDPSIWTAPGDKIDGHELLSNPGWKSFDVIESPRSYVRISPYGWVNEIPSRKHVTETCRGSWMLCPLFIPNDEGGGFAENSLGVVCIYDSEMPAPLTLSSTQWFEKTGEVWSFDAGINIEYAGLRRLDGESVVRNWYAFVFYTLVFYKKINEGYPFIFPIRIELGISDVRNMVWKECAPDIGMFTAKPTGGIAKNDSFVEIGYLRSLNKDDIDVFITKAYNRLLEVFGQAPISQDTLLELVKMNTQDCEILNSPGPIADVS